MNTVYDTINVRHGTPARPSRPPSSFNITERNLYIGSEGGTEPRSVEFIAEHLDEQGVDERMEGSLVADVEGPRRQNRRDPDRRVVSDQLMEDMNLLQRIRDAAPWAKKVALYGFPFVRIADDWRTDQAISAFFYENGPLKALADHVDVLCPVYYWRWLLSRFVRSETHRPLRDFRIMADRVKLLAEDYFEKPVVPYTMGLFPLNAHPSLARKIPPRQYARMVRIIGTCNYWGLVNVHVEHDKAVYSNFNVARRAA